MKINNKEFADLLNIANDFRRETGLEILDDIPESEREEPEHCIIANAFNNGCTVFPCGMITAGWIYFISERDRDKYCELTNIEKGNKNDGENVYPARLTEELNKIAINFDQGLYKEYEQVDTHE